MPFADSRLIAYICKRYKCEIMKDRILLFMKNEGLTNSRLAELIGVQSSNISHIINGRNKPGFDFIANILRRFPTLNPHWLILGVGEIYLTPQKPILLDEDEPELSGIRSDITNPAEIKIPNIKDVNLFSDSNINFFNDEIEKIILLKKDGTFITYSAK